MNVPEANPRPVVTFHLKGGQHVTSAPVKKADVDRLIEGYNTFISTEDARGSVTIPTASDAFAVIDFKQIRHITVSRYPRS